MAVASWFEDVNRRFSPYLETSEVCRLNAGAIGRSEVSIQFEEVLLLCERTKAETGGYFDVARDGLIDPSGLVKGWAIEKASALLSARGFTNYFVEAGGDVQAVGLNSDGQPWQVGVRNPFKRDELVKVLAISDRGVATSGSAIRGQHIFDPHSTASTNAFVSLTVIGPSIYEADDCRLRLSRWDATGLFFHRRATESGRLCGYGRWHGDYTRGFTRYVR